MEGIRPTHLGARALAPGDVLGRHELLMPIAKGGMGQVWAARLHGTRGFQKLVAIKTILPSNEDAGNLESMLFEEASLASLVHHPNVVETLDLGEHEDGTMYLVMEWVSGEPLDAILRAALPVGGVPTPMIVHFALQALCGLRGVHEACNARGDSLGIVHRDISPQNLLISYEGLVKIIDFGIAKATQQMSRPTEQGMVKGKFAYMSPEQLRGESLDGRADLFSMGVVLYRATTGVHPFHSDNLAATIRNILVAEPQKPTALVPGYSSSLEEVVLKALSKDRSERFGSAQEMMGALERAVPEARARGMDKQCEAFLRQLCHDRIAERTLALQSAMKAADETGAVKIGDPGPRYVRSQSTMRAVSREMVAEASDPVHEPERESGKSESASANESASASENESASAGKSSPTGGRAMRRALASVGVIMAVGTLAVAGLIGSRKSPSSHAGRASRGAGETRSVEEAPSIPAQKASRGADGPAAQSAPLPAPSSSVSSSASAVPAPNPSRPAAAPKRHAPPLAEPGPAAPPSGAPTPAGSGAGTPVDDPLSRRR